MPAGTSDALKGRQQLFSDIVTALRRPRPIVVLDGEPGVGKTALWTAVRQELSGWQTWSVRCSEAESDLGLAVLADLFGWVADSAVAMLSPPLKRVVDIVLYRDEPAADDAPLDERALGTATLALLTAVAATDHVLLAIDDLQWCDHTSLRALEYALRRIDDARVAVLATWRGSSQLGLPDQHIVTVGPLDPIALRELIRRSAASQLRPGVVERIATASAGNAMFAIELTRAVGSNDTEVSLPSSLRDVLAGRLASVPPASRPALCDIAVLGAPRVEQVDQVALGDAVQAKIVVVESGRARFTHPLLATAVLERSTPAQLRAAHARAVGMTDDPIDRVLHRARAGGGDPAIAHELDDALALATSRGDLDGARTLVRLALEHGRSEPRLIALAELEAELGDPTAAAELAGELLAAATDDHTRNRALRILAWAQDDVAIADKLLLEAAALADLSDEVRLATRAQRGHLLRIAVRPLQAARELDAVVHAAPRGSPAWASAAAHSCVINRLLGRHVDLDLLAEAVNVDRTEGCDRPSLALSDAGVLAYLDDRHDEARRLLDEAAALALSHGGYPTAGLYSAAVDCRVGDLDGAEQKLLAYLDRKTGVDRTPVLHDLAHVRVWQGRSEEAALLLAEAVELERGLTPRDLGRRLYVSGLADLLDGRVAPAYEQLRDAAEHQLRRHVREPSLVPVLPVAVEAAAAVGELEQASLLCERLEADSEAVESRWGRAAALAARAHLARAAGDDTSAADLFAQAAEAFVRLGVHLQAGRAYLELGALQRRAGHRRVARTSLDAAQQIFTRSAAAGLVRATQLELGRIGGRTAAGDGLTIAERQVADLVVTGIRNAEIAQQLHVSTKTVETHLGRVYRKLGVANRVELTRLLSVPT